MRGRAAPSPRAQPATRGRPGNGGRGEDSARARTRRWDAFWRPPAIRGYPSTQISELKGWLMSRFRRWSAWLGAVVAAVVIATAVSEVVGSSPPASAFTYARNAWWVSGPLGQTLKITPSGLAQIEGI